jgi:ferric-dicitrate binding protein FerR (iron transport regulator)
MNEHGKKESRQDREAREALERVRRDSETVGTSALARMSQRAQDHFSARDAVGASDSSSTDPVELWGRRIGRALSLVGVIVLGLWLLVQLRIL